MPATRSPGVRALIGWTFLYGLHLFPASLPLLPVIAPLRWAGDRIQARWPVVVRLGATAHYALATVSVISLGRIVPFLAPSDVAWALGACALATLGTCARVGGSPWWVAPLALALPLALAPPIAPAWAARVGIFAASATAMLGLLLVTGSYARQRASALAWGFAVLVASVAFRIVLFWLLPTAHPAAILERIPGLAEVVVRPAPNPGMALRRGLLPISYDDLRFVVQGCEADTRLVGTLHSLYLRREGTWTRVGYPPGDRIEVDCDRGVAWVPEMVREKLWSVDLETFEVRKPFEHCEDAGPTLIRFNRERTALYGFPRGQHLGRYDPQDESCQIALAGSVIVSYSVDELRGEALVARNGRVDTCPLDGSSDCSRSVVLTDPSLPAWLQGEFLSRPFFVGHFNKLVRDVSSASVLATSIQSGRLYRLDRATLEIRDSIFLERGIRWVNIDSERRRIFVGGFVRGTLFVLDADSLEIQAEVFLGRKIRYLEVMPDGHLLVAASTGAFEIDVNALLAAAPGRLRGLDTAPRVSELRTLPNAMDGSFAPGSDRG